MRKLYLELHFVKINQGNEIENFQLQIGQRTNLWNLSVCPLLLVGPLPVTYFCLVVVVVYTWIQADSNTPESNP